ncbi:filamentous hemagglutinin N-terminal domain-containing protein [Sulfurospirillum sp. UCH001]|uniref:two-partner secretion domain-containing protein n=1 Tax=Sulfurospirillum sp. UCH001 TaxID=1581011 RepID=UPI000829F175|nr:filamentous hemagglutinin N-terminal domain-containing protein [Sulfurospirillum sp. UCH001]
MRNSYTQVWDYNSYLRIPNVKISLIVSALLVGTTLLHASPSNGTVMSGSATITQNGTITNINQSTQKASINWSTFSIGSNETVNFNQPNVSSITLNRVVGNEKSVIDGALNANGQVWILNSNGVLFNKNASINTSGLLATTKSLSDADFQAGNYTFTGDSKANIINLGTIDIANSGYAALLANTVSNEGTIKAVKGTIELVGGDAFNINLNGNSLVNLTVTKGVLDALVENKGALIANGGEIYLTTNAVNDLLKGVVNNTGVIEAQTLDDVTGKIELYAHGGTANVNGTLDASAPNSGNGGFIETSGETVHLAKSLYVTTSATQGKTGNWLIDPATYLIATSGGNETGASLATRLLSSNIEIQADNTITVNDVVSWSANKLTLNSGGDIVLNANLIASGTATLALYYGQSSANGGSNRYTVADGVDILIPTASAFTWKKGSSGTVTNLVLDNGNLRFGNGTQASVNDYGLLLQPWYYDEDRTSSSYPNKWYPLTYSNYPLDIALGVGGAGSGTWNTNGTISYTGNYASEGGTFAKTSSYINIAKYFEKTGTITASDIYTFGAYGSMRIDNSYTLLANTNYLKAVTSVKNISGADQTNVRLWVGTRDDWVAENDRNYKTKGNITETGFEAITSQSDTAKAILVSERNDGVTGAAILFYSTTEGANTLFNNYGDFYNRIVTQNPTNSAITAYHDGSYALFMSLGNLANNASGSITWYYAAAPLSQINDAITQVGQSAGVIARPTLPNITPPSVISAIVNNTAIEQPRVVQTFTPQHTTNYAPPTTYVRGGESITLASTAGNENANILVSLSEIRQMQRASGTPSGTTEQSTSGETTGVDASIRVPLSRGSLIDIVNGGVKLPENVEQEFYVLNQTQR